MNATKKRISHAKSAQPQTLNTASHSQEKFTTFTSTKEKGRKQNEPIFSISNFLDSEIDSILTPVNEKEKETFHSMIDKKSSKKGSNRKRNRKRMKFIDSKGENELKKMGENSETIKDSKNLIPIISICQYDEDLLDIPKKRPLQKSISMICENNEDYGQESELSTKMQCKMRQWVTDLRRRTNAIKQETIRPPTPDNDVDSYMSIDTGQFAQGLMNFCQENAVSNANEHSTLAMMISCTDSLVVRKHSFLSFMGMSRMSEGSVKIREQQQRQQTSLDGRIGKFWGSIERNFLLHSIKPNSNKYLVWLAIVTICFFYNAFCIPLRYAYPYQTSANVIYWMLIDYLCDFIYLLDLFIVKPRLQFLKDGVEVNNKADMRKKYLMNFDFKMDALSLLPLDVLYFIMGPTVILRFPRILKVKAFWQFFNLIEKRLSNPYIIRISKMLCYMVYIIHCNSCLYYMLSAWQGFGQIGYTIDGQWHPNRWVYNNKGNAYIRCFYLTLKLATSIGNNPSPTNVPEYIYMTISWMMGVFVFAVLLGQIRDIVANASRNRTQFRKTMDAVLAKCQKMHVPQEVQNRVRLWFNYTWEQQKILDERQLIAGLPLKLQTDVALSVHYHTLSKVQLFQDCERSLIRELVLKLKSIIFLPGDIICLKGEVGKEMYIISKGILEVVGGANNTIVYAQMSEGKVFGEISLLSIGGNNRRTATIRSKGYSNLFVLSKDDLNKVIRDYPDAQKMLQKKARHMLNNDAKVREQEEQERKVKRDRFRRSMDISPTDTPRIFETVVKMLISGHSTIGKTLKKQRSLNIVDRDSDEMEFEEMLDREIRSRSERKVVGK